MNPRLTVLLPLAVLLFGNPLASPAAAVPVQSVQQNPDGVTLAMQPGLLRLQVWSDKIIRVTYTPGATLPNTPSLAVIAQPAAVKWDFQQSPNNVTVSTASLQARVNRATGAVGFFDSSGRPLLQESADDNKIFALTPVANLTGTSVRQSFVLDPVEAIYGLGQHQSGVFNYRGTTVHLQQENREVAVPVLVSSLGYGVLWDNPAVTDIAVGAPGHESLVTWTSEIGPAVDYYFMLGPTADGVVQDYRFLTGPAPLMPKWLWGFWQCKEHYASQAELLAVAQQYRQLGIPIDGIIQDWQYWLDNTWGSDIFDPSRYPDPAALTKTLHDLHLHILISVWAKFDLGTDNYKKLNDAHDLYPQVIPSVFPKDHTQWYDAFNPGARQLYWQEISDHIFSLGFDGWWLDASEPELSGKWGEFRAFQTAAGPGATVFNAYPLQHTTGVYQGQRAQTDQQRVVILTRSAYAGQQRNSAITWSGDIRGNWDVFAKQIPAGLNFSLSGIPYWNTDIGGFFGAKRINAAYTQLFTRWFQFGAFCPMFRVHGTNAPKEMWRFDDPTQKILITYDTLRYRLLPYIYSVSWQVTNNGYTMMRPLVMDFPTDPAALNIKDQYLFGPAIMVCPVITANATTRPVYLPGSFPIIQPTSDNASFHIPFSAPWYDFWTGQSLPGNQTITAPAPIETMPLYVRAGSIIPLGPVIQYSAEKPDPIELRVYRGQDGAFTLYEDDGTTYDYEKGAYATIPFTWSNQSSTLTIGARTGSFPGMLAQRTFRVVFVSPNHGAGLAVTTDADQEITYTGAAVTVRPKS